MSNTRSLRNRSSRYSSPATFTSANQGAAVPVQETIEVRQLENGVQDQSQQGAWVEPTPRHGVASFEDTKGLERLGVLEHMQALGVAPNQKLLQRLKVNNYRSSLSARATPVYSEGVASPSVEPTKEEVASPTIDPELLFDATTPPAPPRQQTHPGTEPVQEQDQARPESRSLAPPHPQSPPQYRPQFYAAPPAPAFPQLPEQPPPPPMIMSPPRGRPAKKEVEEMRVYPGPDDSFLSPMANGTPRSSRASPRYPPSVSEHSKDARIRAYLQNAIDRAHRENKHDVAAGLLRVMDESNKDEVFTALDNISKYKASVRIEQFKVFKKYIKKGIRKHRRDSTRQPQFHDDRAPPPPQSQPIAFYSSFQMNTKRPTILDRTVDDNNHNNAMQPSLGLNTRIPENTNDASPENPSVHSPFAIDTTMTDLPTDLPLVVPPKPSPRKRRSSSGSSLSSAQSLPSDYHYIATDELADQDQAAVGRPTRAAAQRQAPARAASSRITRLSGIDQQPGLPSAGANPLGQQTLELTSLSVDNVRAKKQKLTPTYSPDHNETIIEQERQKFEYQLDRSREDWKTARLGDDMRSDIDDHKRWNPPKTLEPYTGPPPPVIHPNALVPSTAEMFSPASNLGDTIAINSTSRKRPHDDYLSDNGSDLTSSESLSSPPPPTFMRLSVGASSTRASTPRTAKSNQILISRKKQRTMDSPRKIKGGANSLGAARAGISIDAAVANSADASEETTDNDDSCRACGGPSERGHALACCDGCTNSFHSDCLEPPVGKPEDLPDPWFCPECEAKRRGPAARSTGLVSGVIDFVTDMYPRAFNLPQDIRNYFENVRTGDEGEYIEDQPQPTNRKGAPRSDNNGALKPPDYKAVLDNKGKVRLCYKCGLGTDGKREMIPCDYCNDEWHLDCLNPPAATVPKHFNAAGKPVAFWRCPHHIEDDLKRYGRPTGAQTGEMGRRPRLRRPRNAISKEPFIPQRIPNNGVIDVQLEPEEPELDIKTVEMGGVVFKVPEKQIKLDFLAAAKSHFYDDITIPRSQGVEPTKFHSKHYLPCNPRFREAPAPETWSEIDGFDAAESEMPNGGRPASTVVAHEEARIRAQAAANTQLRNKSFIEQRTIIGLTELANEEAALNGRLDDTFGAHIPGLTNRLIADASDEVFELINMSEADEYAIIARLAQKRADELRGHGKQANKLNKTQQRNSKAKSAEATKVNGTLGHDHSES